MNRDPNSFRVIVVGAGPAGLMAALCAARAGGQVLVLEQRPEAGTRLLATGGGHCNFANTLRPADFIRRFGVKSRFVTPALRAMTGDRLRLFFEELGVPSHSPDGFHVLPVDDSARSVRDALLQACRQQGVTFSYNSRVDGLRIGKNHTIELITTGVSHKTTTGPTLLSLKNDPENQGSGADGQCPKGETIPSDRVILAAGGASYPVLGGGEIGYKLARMAGHTIVSPCPALVPLVSRESWPGTLAGITLPRVAIRLANPGNSQVDDIETGSLLFTHRGISGPVTLDISGRVARALMTNDCVPILIDLMPDQTPDAWHQQVEGARKDHGAKAALSWLRFLLPTALAGIVLDLAGLPPSLRIAELSRAMSHALFHLIKNLPITIAGTEGFGKAMAAQGGVHLDEIWPKTMESKLVAGLFIVGEVLDIDGPCGGFNLQWAFSSGFLAGHMVLRLAFEP